MSERTHVWEAVGVAAIQTLGPHAQHEVFATAAWFELLATHGLSPGSTVRLFSVRDEAGCDQFSVPMLDGPELSSLSNYYSCLYAPIVSASPQAEDIALLCRHWRRRPATPVIRLQPLDAGAPFTAQLFASLRHAGFWANEFFCFGNWYLPVSGRTYSEWFETLPGKLRSTIQRHTRKLATEGDWSTRIVDRPGDELEAAIGDFVKVYANSWKTPEPYPSFVPELCRLAARKGWLRLGVMRRGSTPVAAQLWLHCDGRSMIYKLAYDEAFVRYSAGSILTAAMMKHAFDVDRAREIDYLSGDDAYKKDWMSHRRVRIGIVAFNPWHPRGFLAGARHFVGRVIAALRRTATNPP
jgi:CelD/BcsL family acetyltransferase involved in cellulose biosynthesis